MDINAAEVIEFLQRQPFEPFAIHESDGPSHEIRHPDLVIVTPRAAHIGITSNGEEGVVQRVAVCDLRQVTQLAPLRKPGAKRKTYGR